MYPHLRSLSLLLMGGLLITLPAFSQSIFYVTQTGGGNQDGSEWAHAYAGTQLQTAIDAASTYWQTHPDQTVEVWVGQGLYTPTTDGNREVSFSMRDQVAIYGGFVGHESQVGQRPAITLTIPSSTTLSGDIGEADNPADNSKHVISNKSLSVVAVLDGFVITGGNSSGNGGGMYNNGGTGSVCSPTVRHCLFVGNKAASGGGMYNESMDGGASSPVLTNCSFISNSAIAGGGITSLAVGGTNSPTLMDCIFSNNTNPGGGGEAGGMLIRVAGGGVSNPILTNCSFISNANFAGGGLVNDGGSPMLTNCSFDNNQGGFDGGGIKSRGGNPVLTNCSFANNTANVGGGMSNSESNPQFINCTFTGNTILYEGGAIHGAVGGLTNCIFWNNNGNKALSATSITAKYCLFDADVTGYLADPTNLTATASPFVSTTDLQLRACSPAVNTGDPNSTTETSGATDLAGNPRIYNGRIDIGAFEFQSNPLVAPVLSVSPSVTQPILQNTPYVTLTVTGCEGGTVNWKGPDGVSGSGTSISVPTSATGTLVYSATCTVGSCTSPPGSLTVTISPPLVTGSFDGFIYGADCSTFRGWTWDRNKPNTAFEVDILDGPTVIATLWADVFRPDLQTAGKGNGKHAFFFTIPDELKDGKPHTLSARIKDSSFMLKDSPKALICEGVPVPGGNQPPVPPTPTILTAPLVAQVGVPFSGTLVAFTDPEGQPLIYKLSGLPDGLSINETTRVVSGAPTESGTFVLAYSATETNPNPLTNSVSFPLTVNPQSTTTVTGSFEGYLDKVECTSLRGWVWDRHKPNTPLTVEFYTDGKVWGSTVANIYRVDLKDAGKGNGAHAYNFTVPEALKSGSHLIRARVLGSSYELKTSGRYLPLPCPAAARLSAETGSGLSVFVLSNPVSDRVDIEVQGAEGQPLRIQLIDARGRLVSQHQISTAQAIEQHSLSVQEQALGLLLLRVSSGLKSRTLKIVKQ